MSTSIEFGLYDPLHDSVIYKYPLDVTESQKIIVPVGSHVLHVAEQQGQIYLWILQSTNPNLPKVGMEIKIVGTGHKVNLFNYVYVGTVHQNDFVWHVFV